MRYLVLCLLLLQCHIDREFRKKTEDLRDFSCKKNKYAIEYICTDEEALLDWASSYPKYSSLQSMTQENLQRVAQDKSIDHATALFYHRMISEPKNRRFRETLQELEEGTQDTTQLSEKLRFLVIPGMFYEDNPNVGANGEYPRAVAKSLGIAEGLIAVGQDNTVEANAQIICRYLQRDRMAGSIIIGSISKGTADMKVALQRCGQEAFFRKVRAWISFSGISQGTYLVNYLEQDWWASLEVRYYFWKNNYSYQALQSLRVTSYSVLQEKMNIPKSLLLVNILGVALENAVTNRAKPMYQALSRYGPNEGMNLLAHSYVSQGVSYPIWRNDHYLRFPLSQAKLRALFIFLVQKIYAK
ncbi:MAG: hypothetical protein AAF518_15285 [Spirochaetota bacterium]